MDIINQLDPEIRAAFLALPAGLGESAEAVLRLRHSDPSSRIVSPPGGNQRKVYVPGSKGTPDVLVHIFEPERRLRELPALIWLHGGGYFRGSTDLDNELIVSLVRDVNCIVVSVDYRLAPEDPFPAAIEDSHAALVWVMRNAQELGVDTTRIALGGESGGGGLAAGLALYARDRAEVPIAFQLLLAPMLDDRGITHANKRITDTRLYNAMLASHLWNFYLGESVGASDVSQYAAAARAIDLSRLPPTYIGVGEFDLFVDESMDYAQRLLVDGVQIELNIYPGAYHGFNRNAPEAQVSKKFNADRNAALVRALHG